MRNPRTPDGIFHRSMRVSVFMGLLASLFIAVYGGPGLAGRYLLFTAWMLLNLSLWSYGAREMTGRRRGIILVLLGAAKLFWLAFLGVRCGWGGGGGENGNTVIFLLGFNTPFLVMSLKAMGSLLAGETGKKRFSPPKKGINQSNGSHSTAD